MVFREKKELLELYNALHRTHYTNPDDLKIVTLENAIYMGMKNDLSFLFMNQILLYEHQSSVNPNLPLRDLFYIADEFQKLVVNKSLYTTTLVTLPTPHFVENQRESQKELPHATRLYGIRKPGT